MQLLCCLEHGSIRSHGHAAAVCQGNGHVLGDGPPRYGHSLARPIRYEPCTPPPRLYHATSPDTLASIRREGLRPMERQYVHLSPDPETAIHVGARHADRPVVLTVRAAEAHAAGVEFHQADEAIYLARHIPAEFLEFPARR